MGCAKVKIDGKDFAVCKYEASGEGPNAEHVQCLKRGCPEQECGQDEESEPEPEQESEQEEEELVCDLALSSDPSQCLVSTENLVWSDEFDGTEINRNNWNTDLGDGENRIPGAEGGNFLKWTYLGFITD